MDYISNQTRIYVMKLEMNCQFLFIGNRQFYFIIYNGNTAVILSACITAMVTIIGFVVTYFLNKRNFKEEINKQQVNIHLDKIAELPYKIQELMDIILDKKNDKAILSKFKDRASYPIQGAIKKSSFVGLSLSFRKM